MRKRRDPTARRKRNAFNKADRIAKRPRDWL
jgi:hypothetical protein